LGFSSRRATEKALGGLNDLRHQTMHLVRPLLERVPEDLVKLQERVSRTRDLLEKSEVP
jgi:hypothetical protein